MHILFINLCVRRDTPKKIPNVGLAYVMGAAHRAGFDFSLIDMDLYRYSDEEFEQIIKERQCDVVAFGALASLFGQVQNISGMIRCYHPTAKLVLGNTLATASTDIVLQKTDIDICVLGEGEETFIELMKVLDKGGNIDNVAGIAYLRDGRAMRTGNRPIFGDLDEIPLLNFEKFKIEKYWYRSKVFA